MRKPAIEITAQRLPPGIANPAASYQDALCRLLVQQSQCLQHHGMPDLKVETFTGNPLRFQFFYDNVRDSCGSQNTGTKAMTSHTD